MTCSYLIWFSFSADKSSGIVVFSEKMVEHIAHLLKCVESALVPRPFHHGITYRGLVVQRFPSDSDIVRERRPSSIDFPAFDEFVVHSDTPRPLRRTIIVT